MWSVSTLSGVPSSPHAAKKVNTLKRSWPCCPPTRPHLPQAEVGVSQLDPCCRLYVIILAKSIANLCSSLCRLIKSITAD